ncbi:MAG: hypothetical protein ACRDRJ_33065 [Streptosporangiaceae bacterium]
MVSRIKRSVPVTVNDVLDGQVQLDLDCLDRLYLHGYLAQLQVGGQVIQFLQHRGFPVPSPACLQQIGDAFRRRVASFADANHIAVVTLKAADRNIEVMKPYLDRAAATGRSQVAAIGVAQEMQRVLISRQRSTDPGKCPQFSFDKKDRRVTVYYFYLWDAGFGPAFIKICTYCPWPMKIWVNGHEWAKQQARKIGLGFTELSNGFAACEDPALLQRICDVLQPGTISVFFQRWLSRLPVPLDAADQRAGYWWELSMAQVEVSRTLVFTQPRHARTFFEALVTDNLDLGRPDTIEIIFDRRIITGQQRATRGTFKTKVITRGTEITINAFYRHSRIKQYLKDGRALRIETVINSPTDLRIGRRIACLDELQDAARAINARLLDTERAGQGCILANPVFERIAHPSLTADGRRATAMRFGDSRVQALASALCHTVGAVTGITNRSLRALMTGLLGTPYTMTQASYDLARLRRNGLITRRPHANTYDLTPDGLAFAIFYTKVHDRVLAPLFTTGQPQAPPQLRAALHDIEQLIDNRLADARLPKAA